MSANTGTPDKPIIIKKYANRRLYNTHSSSYITLDDLAQMTRDGVDFQVLDAKTGADITHGILTRSSWMKKPMANRCCRSAFCAA